MKKGWTYKKFVDCINKIPKQRQVKSKDYLSSGLYPIVSQEKELVSGYWNDEDYLYKHDKPIIIFGDHTKEIKYIDFDFVVGADGTQILQPKDDIDSRFFYYALLATPIRSLGYARHFKLLKEKSFLIPKLTEQKRIVKQLDATFEQIDELKAYAEKQLAEARALFQKSLAKAMEPKKGWEEKKVKDLSLLITKGSSPKWQGNSYVDSDGILFVTSENVREGNLVLNPAKYVDKSFNQKQRRSILKKDDVLVNIVGASIGRAAIFDIDVEDANINQAVCLVRPDKQRLSPHYLCLFLNSEHAFNQYTAMVKDTARANLSLENIGSLIINIPPLSEQQRIVERLDSISENVRKYEDIQRKIIAECDALKQALLRQVFE